MSNQYSYQCSSLSASSSSHSASSTSSAATPVDIPSFSMASFSFESAVPPMPSPSLDHHQQFFNPLAAQSQHFNTPYGSSPETHSHTQVPQQQARYNLRSHAAQKQQSQLQQPQPQPRPQPQTELTFSSPFSQNAQPMNLDPQQYRHNSFSSHPLPSRQSSTSSTSSEPYLRDFSLLAEAAKRAQMACMTRDLEEMEF